MESVSLIAPSGHVTPERIDISKVNLAKFNFNPIYHESLFETMIYYAGTPERRAKEINDALSDKDTKKVFCVIGGMGVVHTLHLLDYEKFKDIDKTVVGYSDITLLLLALYKKTNLKLIHGPNMGIKDMKTHKQKKTLKYLNHALNGEEYIINVKDSEVLVNKDKVSAPITGGNLSLIGRTLGTEFEIETKGHILFFEQNIYSSEMIFDIFWQLKHAGKFDNVKGVILGNFRRAGKNINHYLELFFKEFNVPVIYKQQIGHIHPNISIPLGATCEIDTKNKYWKIIP